MGVSSLPDPRLHFCQERSHWCYSFLLLRRLGCLFLVGGTQCKQTRGLTARSLRYLFCYYYRLGTGVSAVGSLGMHWMGCGGASQRAGGLGRGFLIIRSLLFCCSLLSFPGWSLQSKLWSRLGSLSRLQHSSLLVLLLKQSTTEFSREIPVHGPHIRPCTVTSTMLPTGVPSCRRPPPFSDHPITRPCADTGTAST